MVPRRPYLASRDRLQIVGHRGTVVVGVETGNGTKAKLTRPEVRKASEKPACPTGWETEGVRLHRAMSRQPLSDELHFPKSFTYRGLRKT